MYRNLIRLFIPFPPDYHDIATFGTNSKIAIPSWLFALMAALRGLFNRLGLAHTDDGDFKRVRAETTLFPQTTPEVDGEECLRDCDNCQVHYPAKFPIEETSHLYGHVKAWHRHLVVATGASDWIRNVTSIKGSVMESVHDNSGSINHGRLMLSASNMPIPHSELDDESATRCILLPAFITIDNVTPSNIPDLIKQVINTTSTTVSPLPTSSATSSLSQITLPAGSPFKIKPCPHDYLILLCSHKTRDARCGQSAPLLRKEFERHLRPLGLLRDLHDERTGGVGIYFINHVGGHKFAANVIIYRRSGTTGAEKQHETVAHAEPARKANAQKEVTEGKELNGTHPEKVNGVNGEKNYPGEAGQCIWLARVRPEDCENIVRYTVLQGKVVKPERQLRGGFDRCKQLASW